MRHPTTIALLCGLALCAPSAALIAQRQSAAAITDTSDPRFLTAQTRKQGGVMPAEQLALIFDHLDHALKVYPSEQRIEGTTTLSFTTRAPIGTLILDLYPKYAISSIAITAERHPQRTAAGVRSRAVGKGSVRRHHRPAR